MNIIFSNFRNKFVRQKRGDQPGEHSGDPGAPRALADLPDTTPSLWSPCGYSSENSHIFLKNVTVQFRGRCVDPCNLPRKPLRVLTITVKCLILESK